MCDRLRPVGLPFTTRRFRHIALDHPVRAQRRWRRRADFEPLNRGFADLPLRPLGYVASDAGRRGPAMRSAAPRDVGCPSRIRTSLHGFKVRCPTARRRGSGGPGRRVADEEWSGRRDSNPRPSPWQGDALPTEPLPPGCHDHRIAGCRWCREPGSNWRHRDFQSRALPTELSRPDDRPRLVARRRGGGYHGPSEPFNEAGRAAADGPAEVRRLLDGLARDHYPSRSRGRLPNVPLAITRRRSGPGDRGVTLAKAAREPAPRTAGVARGGATPAPVTGAT